MADFVHLPTWVDPIQPEYNNIITKSEGMKKEYYSMSSTPIEQFKLKFEGLSDADFKLIFEHYHGQMAGYGIFNWKNSYIPDYIKTLLGIAAGDLSGRWVEKSFKFKPHPHSWEAELVFEKNV